MASAVEWTHKQAVVIDCGTGYTKMGHSGNTEPSFTIPTAIAAADEGVGDSRVGSSSGGGIPDLDFFVGDEAS